jgi:acyl-CoA thioester hydrolase
LTDNIRYRDTDRRGPVNNAVFSTSPETGRVELLYDPNEPLRKRTRARLAGMLES